MTSFIINSHLPRRLPKSWDVDCPFCRILSGELPSFKIYENEHVIAFLGPSPSSNLISSQQTRCISHLLADILPLRPGHTLVIPKTHIQRLSDLPDDVAGELGKAVVKIANALVKAMGEEAGGLNVVCNQGE